MDDALRQAAARIDNKAFTAETVAIRDLLNELWALSMHAPPTRLRGDSAVPPPEDLRVAQFHVLGRQGRTLVDPAVDMLDRLERHS